MKTYGTSENPFPELPPAASLYSVSWGGTVKWPTAPFSFLEKTGVASPPLTDSYTGTLSFWFRVNGTLGADTDKIVPILFVPAPALFSDAFDIGLSVFISRIDMLDAVSALRFSVQIQRQPGDIESIFQVETEEFESSSPTYLAPDLCDNKWAHFHVTWDALNATGLATVNKLPYGPYIRTLSIDRSDPESAQTVDYVAAEAPWSATPRFFGAWPNFDAASVIPPDALSANHLISLAHVWVDTHDIITDIAKFVTDDDRPAALGPAGEFLDDTGEVVPGTGPDYYFKGGPAEFAGNRGTGGAMTLIGEDPAPQSVPVKIGA